MTDQVGKDEVLRVVREQFVHCLGEYKAKFDPRDIERVQKNDEFVWRYVEVKSTGVEAIAAAAVKSLITCLLWRKDKKINDLKASDFPQEMFDSGRIRVGWDTNGKFVVVDRIGLYRKNAEWHQMLFEIVAFDMERYNLPTNGRLYIDATGAGYSSLDLQTSLTTAELLTKYYPNTFANVFMYGIPMFVKPFLNIVLGLLPERLRKRVHLIDKAEALEQIKELNIIAPEGCSNLEEVGLRRGISNKAIQKEITQQKWVREQCSKMD